MSSISTENLLTQSKYLYLQSAGSDGSDGSASGIHLRWDLLGTLGDNHIPKGNLAASGSAYYTSAKYNKADDFVKIYRTPYNRNYPVLVDMVNTLPEVTDSQTEKIWKYNSITPNSNLPSVTRNVIVRFTNTYRYDVVKSTYPPTTTANLANFLKNYNAIIEVEVEGKRMFAAYVYMAQTDPTKANITRLEAISLDETTSETSYLFVSGRKKYTIEEGYLTKEEAALLLKEDNYNIELDQLGNGSRKIMAENIQYVRFLGTNCYPTTLWLETYEDFLLGKNNEAEWAHVTDQALSLDQEEVYTRLEDYGNYDINNLWPRYGAGYTVDVANYQDRWLDSTDTDGSTTEGLNTAVKKYLTLSMDASNLEAYNTSAYEESTTEYVSDDTENLTLDDPDADSGSISTAESTDSDVSSQECEISYLNSLKMVALDFHIARMLGLGHIDTNVSDNRKFIYMAVYDTNDGIDTYTTALRHTYLTLPTGKTDYKLPYTPTQADVSYGLYVSCGENDTKLITDANGYNSYGTSRAVNINLTYPSAPYALGYFFQPDEEYSFAEYTVPIMYDIKYKPAAATSWSELCVDTDYKDNSNQYEAMPVVSTGENPIYTHLETNTGVHQYAVYGINWFSRVSSAMSNIEQTDDTEFTHTYTLIPPQNFTAQIIQTEKIRVLTTESEQTRLSGLSGDTTLVRVTFEWDNVNYTNYWYGKQAQFFFRTQGLNVVAGLIKSVTSLGNNLYQVRTTSYNLTSQDTDSSGNVTTVTPSLPAGTESRYVKSLFGSNGNQYQVSSVVQSTVSGEGPVFTVEGIIDTTITETEAGSPSTLAKSTTEPKVGDSFSVSENTTLAECWSKQLSQTVSLTKFSDYTETETYADDTSSVKHIGGIYQQATITEYLDKELNTATNTEVEIAGSITGIFKITFSGNPLGTHPDSSWVEYYKGIVRIAAADGSEMKQLKVVEITTDSSNLVLKVVDPTFAVVSGTYTPDSTYKPIPTSASTTSPIYVNFHPGYRAYLVAETGFNKDVIMPATGEGKKYTYMACRAVDGTTAQSYLSGTVPIVAREIITPVIPKAPSGADYATRPNFFGKATYTFDVAKGDESHDPYMLIFYRASDQIILDTLYCAETVAQIRTDFKENPIAVKYAMDLWKFLVSFTLNSDGYFKKIDSTGNESSTGYGFPNPDNTNYVVPNRDSSVVEKPFKASLTPGSSDSYLQKVKNAIWGAFMPITEQPMLYQYLKTGDQTSPRKPVIYDNNGNYILPGSTNFDQAPMAVKHTTADNKVVTRFTDYTIDGASTAMYFYYAVEMGNTMEVSLPSPITGPIKLMNASAPRTPELRNFYPQVQDTAAGTVTGVVFEVNDYLTSENISQIQIYRAFDSISAQDIRTMTALEPISVGDTIIDTFEDLDYKPYGDPIYYRLVAIRKVPYAIVAGTAAADIISKEDTVMSTPTDLMLANIIDVVNPEAPTPVLSDSTVVTTALYSNVELSWTQTVYNGTYYIYKRNSSGTWTLLGEVESKPTNPAATLTYSLDNLSRLDGDTPIYHSFKITAVNSSGLISLTENVLTI